MRHYIADELNRVMACNGSRLMGVHAPFNPGNDTNRNEGVAAHWLVDQVFNKRFNALELIDRRAPNNVYITGDMVDHTADYIETISAQGGAVEFSYSINGLNWQIDGRIDHCAYVAETQTLHINDYKYGFRLVEPEENWTLISHAMGWIIAHGMQYPARIAFRIHQPRARHPSGENVREWVIDAQRLNELYHELVKTLQSPSDMLRTGRHCYKCPALATCPAAIEAGMNALEAAEMAYNAEVDNDTLSYLLDHSARAIEILEQNLKAYEDLASHRVKAGQIVKNYALEMELTNKQWKEGMTVQIVKLMTGRDLSKNALMTPKQAKSAGVPESVLEPLTERRQKGAKLTRIDANAAARKLLGLKK